MARRKNGLLGPLLLLAFLPLSFPWESARGEVVRVVVDRREEVLGGKEWGDRGPYEKLVGRIFFAFDPENPANARIVDLKRAPRNAAGLVEAWTEFMVLQPKNPARRRGIAWVEVSNRGGKVSLRYFNRAAHDSLDPASAEDFGDGLLLKEGLTLIWLGWQWDVPDRAGLLRLHGTVAGDADGEIQGPVRADWTVDEDTDTLLLSHRDHRAYMPVSPDHPDHMLTVRDGRLAPRRVIPRDQWWFLSAEGGPRVGPWEGIGMEGGFRAGRIYELVYISHDPQVVGLGLAAVRDMLSYAKYKLDAIFPVRSGIAFGVSQTGRFLRHFLYQGFNTDEKGRKVFDGMFIHTAGAGRGSFNHRFAQPSRDGHRYSAFFYPTDLFPFTSRVQRDPLSGREEGLFSQQRPEHLPLVFYTNTGYEYWGRAASLIHTSVDGRQDVSPLENERIYHLAGGQHFVGTFPPEDGSAMEGEGVPVYRGNPLDFSLTLRALAVRLITWVEGRGDPPASLYPRVSDGTLVPVSGMAFPAIPGVSAPRVAHEAYRLDYGPRWWSEGIIDREPPGVGAAFPSKVSQVDGLGNEIAGVRSTELRAPLATYAPWNLRVGYPGPNDELVDFLGTFVPLPRTEEERWARKDPRPSVEGLFGSKEVYMEQARAATRELVREGFLLPQDAFIAVETAEARWDWLMGGATVP